MVGVAVIMLVIGVAIGSVAFPMTKTTTSYISLSPSLLGNTMTITQTIMVFGTTTTTANYGETTFTQTQPDAFTTETVIVANQGGASNMRFGLFGFRIVTTGCGIYQSGPHMSGWIIFFQNYTTVVSPQSLQYFVNGTGSNVQPLNANDIGHGTIWGSGTNNQSITGGAPYRITFVIGFQDGITQSESMVISAEAIPQCTQVETWGVP